jgi:hypothetical protein
MLEAFTTNQVLEFRPHRKDLSVYARYRLHSVSRAYVVSIYYLSARIYLLDDSGSDCSPVVM